MAPFEFSDVVGFALALLFGISFGLSLERGGLGNPHTLTGVFYFRDYTMPKVMFTAILVAATGLYALSDLSLLDISRVWIIPTFFWPQLAGGALFGIGFVMSGYCPGTAVAGIASGRTDALVTMIGVSAGSLLFAILFPSIEEFYLSTDMGTATLDQLLGVNHWIVILALLLLAGGMILLLQRFEKAKARS
jgi:uncharacterized membrane protein YedE/YeeE